jgi:CheY-like chemotaxis protein
MAEPEVLLVDDEQDVLSMLSEFLQMKGFKPTCADSADSAFRVLQERALRAEPPFQAVVSDWMMPGTDGGTLLGKIRSEGFRALPFVLMSGAVTRDVLLTAVRYDLDAVLLKPFSIDALCDKIQEASKVRERKVRERVPADRSG